MALVKPGSRKGGGTLWGPRGEKLVTLQDLEAPEAERALQVIERNETRLIEAEHGGRLEFARLWVYDLVFNRGKQNEKHLLGVTFNGCKKLYKEEFPKGHRLEPEVPGEPLVKEWSQEEDRKEFDYNGNYKGLLRVTVPYFRASVRLVDIVTGWETFGTFDQERWRAFETKEGVPRADYNPHARQIALSKAIRKGMQEKLDPEKYFTKMYAWYKASKNVAQISDLGELKQIGTTADKGGDAKHGIRQIIFGIAGGMGLDTKGSQGDRDAVIRWVEKKLTKPTTVATVPELQAAKDWVEQEAARLSREQFVAAVRGA